MSPGESTDHVTNHDPVPSSGCTLTASGSAARQYSSHLGARCKAGAPYRPWQTVTAATAG